jgi:outer membrane protein insertion porin family
VEEGLIGKIALKGNGSTKDYVILKNLEFKQGQVLSRDRLVVSYQALMALGYFKSVDLVPEWMGDQIAVSVSVVEEKNLGGINGSIAYSPESGGVVGKLDYK